jgi:hypothetical protein
MLEFSSAETGEQALLSWDIATISPRSVFHARENLEN